MTKLLQSLWKIEQLLMRGNTFVCSLHGWELILQPQACKMHALGPSYTLSPGGFYFWKQWLTSLFL